MTSTVRLLGGLMALFVLLGVVSAPTQSAMAHDGDFNHYKKHFYTKKASNDRFVVQRYAVVDAAGNLVRGERVAAATRSNPGAYKVTFDKQVADCAFSVTPLAENGALPIRMASASTGAIWGPNSVGIGIFGSDGNFSDAGFSIVMTC